MKKLLSLLLCVVMCLSLAVVLSAAMEPEVLTSAEAEPDTSLPAEVEPGFSVSVDEEPEISIFAEEESGISISVNRELSEVEVRVIGLAPDTPISFQAFYKGSIADEALRDHLGQFRTDALGAATIQYTSTRQFVGGSILRVIIGGGGLANALEATWEPNKITALKIDALSIFTVARRGSYQFELNLVGEDAATDIVWTIADQSLGYVDDNGYVTIFDKTGNVRLTATDTVSGLTHSITLRIAS